MRILWRLLSGVSETHICSSGGVLPLEKTLVLVTPLSLFSNTNNHFLAIGVFIKKNSSVQVLISGELLLLSPVWIA
jgi:hypothetical protein